MNVRYRVTLTQYERNELGALLSGGKHPARKLKRAQILLAADAGVSDDDIATSVGIGGSTVYRTKRRFVEGNLARALSEELRPGAERARGDRHIGSDTGRPREPQQMCGRRLAAARRCQTVAIQRDSGMVPSRSAARDHRIGSGHASGSRSMALRSPKARHAGALRRSAARRDQDSAWRLRARPGAARLRRDDSSADYRVQDQSAPPASPAALAI